MDLSIDTAQVREIANDIGTQAGLYNNEIATLYSEFTALGQQWQGPDYDAANEVMQQNKQALLDLGTTLLNIQTALNTNADEYDARIEASAAQFRG